MSDVAFDYKIFETLLDGVIVINADGKIRFCNSAMSSLLNIPVKRIKNDTLISSYVSFVPELFQMFTPSDLSLMTEGTPYREVRFNSKAGKMGLVQVSIQPLGQPMGQAMGQPKSQAMSQPAGQIDEPLWILYIRDVTLEETLHSKYRIELEKKESAIEKLQKAQKKLKEYSETLEKKVEQRTEDLANSNQKLTAMVNSLGQAFVIVDKEGICSKTYSKVTLKLLETDPSDKPLSTVLKIPREQETGFQNWLKLLLSERLPFDELVHLGPKTFQHSKNRYVALEFHPVREAEKFLTGIVVVATDKTDEIVALRQAEQEQANAKRILKLTKYKDLFWPFVSGATKMLGDLRSYLNDPKTVTENMEKILRAAHTLKGEANLFWISSVAKDIHEFENLLTEIKMQPREQIKAMTLKAQTLLSKAEIDLKEFLVENEPIVGPQKSAIQKHVDLPYDKLQLFHTKLQPQKDLAEQFENEFLREPVGKYFSQYDDLVVSIAKKSGKSINPIVIKGQDVRLIVDDYPEFLDCFVHLITNAVDHGIETPEIRTERNKDVHGTISISISEVAGGLEFVIEDDGDGIDPNKIREKLEKSGVSYNKKETDSEVIQHIFDAGFSSSEDISTTSGRGIGLHALFNSVKNLGGSIKVNSVPQKGTQFEIILPEKRYLRAA